MSSTQNPSGSKEGKKEDDEFRRLSELEAQRREAGDIVQRWFRFRARRALGVFYALLSSVSIFGNILGAFSNSEYVLVEGVTVAVICVWFVARMSGLQWFARMNATVDLLTQDSDEHKQNHARAAILFVATSLWPWFGYAVATFLGLFWFRVFFAVVWLVQFTLYRIVTLRRNKHPIVCHKVDDWVVVVSIPMGAILSTLPVISNISPFFGFAIVSPFWLFAGVKSLYDAPKELVRDIDTAPE